MSRARAALWKRGGRPAYIQHSMHLQSWQPLHQVRKPPKMHLAVFFFIICVGL